MNASVASSHARRVRSAVSAGAAETAERTRRAWEEATEAFKKKVRERERIEIDAS